ncbi:hypothetical protein LSH36_32g16069 [Paralvinella palmiformis]|uniref:Uncharacterized protein n=1 Tax=Paralvinella palmiformis TaxID=53620 RepID=A0AAD9KAW3_9ANNE|nr:hypothetical protein LSH36_32g16069 [Paralvinella palmiformis]
MLPSPCFTVATMQAVVISDGLVSTWVEWDGSGYVGLSEEELSHNDAAVQCQSVGDVLLEYQDSTSLNEVLVNLIPMGTPVWTKGDDNKATTITPTTTGQIVVTPTITEDVTTIITTESETTTELTTISNATTSEKYEVTPDRHSLSSNETTTSGYTGSTDLIGSFSVYATEWDVTCNSHACPEWNDWSMWNDCSATCGTGTRRRYRTCLGEDDFKCTGESHETDFCNANPCPGSKTIVILCVRVPQKPPEENPFTESDKRPLAIGLGSLSMMFVFIELIMIIMIDSVTITMQCRVLKRNLRHLSP